MHPCARRPARPPLGCLLLSAWFCATPVLAAPERQGEAFTFSMSVGPIEGGRARLAIAPPYRKGQERLVNVVAEAEAVGLARVIAQLHDDYRMVLDVDTLLPRHIEMVEKTGQRQRTLTAELSGRRADILVVRAEAQKRIQGDLPVEPHDPVAALLAMRTSRLRNGDRLELVLLEGTSFYKGSVEVAGRETLDTPEGPRSAIRLRCRGERIDEKGTKIDRPVRQGTIWLSDDRYRVPLRIEGETELGTVHFDLTSYQPPRHPLPAPTRLPGVSTLRAG